MKTKCQDGTARQDGAPRESALFERSQVAAVAFDTRRHDLKHAQIILSQLLTPPAPVAFRDVVARYIAEHVEVRQRPRTADRTRITLRRLVAQLGDIPIHEIGNAHAIATHRRRPKASAGLEVAILRAVLNKARKWGLRGEHDIDPALCKDLSRPRTAVVIGDDAERWLRALDDLDARAFPCDRLKSTTECLRFLMATGLRRDEARVLTWDRVAADCSSCYLDESKTGPRHVVFGAMVRAQLAALKQRRVGRYVFPGRDGRSPVGARTVQVAMREAAKIAGLHGVVVHSLRHSAATRAMQLRIPARVIQEAFGWSTERQIKRYQHVQADDLRAAMDEVAIIVKDGGHG